MHFPAAAAAETASDGEGDGQKISLQPFLPKPDLHPDAMPEKPAGPAKGARPVKEAKEPKESKESKESKEPRDATVAKEAKEPKDAKEAKEAKEAKIAKEAGEPKEARAAKGEKAEKGGKDEKEAEAKPRAGSKAAALEHGRESSREEPADGIARNVSRLSPRTAVHHAAMPDSDPVPRPRYEPRALAYAAHAAHATHPARRAPKAAAPLVADSPVTYEKACRRTSWGEIAGLFDRWNRALATQDTDQVMANYAPDAILLPAMSNEALTTPAQIREYFDHFLANSPSGKVVQRVIHLNCNMATDVGIYRFTVHEPDGQTREISARYTFLYEWRAGRWLIAHHHSSAMPVAVNMARVD